jgi:hypothetical protein
MVECTSRFLAEQQDEDRRCSKNAATKRAQQQNSEEMQHLDVIPLATAKTLEYHAHASIMPANRIERSKRSICYAI